MLLNLRSLTFSTSVRIFKCSPDMSWLAMFDISGKCVLSSHSFFPSLHMICIGMSFHHVISVFVCSSSVRFQQWKWKTECYLLQRDRKSAQLVCFRLSSAAQEFVAKSYTEKAIEIHERLRGGLVLVLCNQDVQCSCFLTANLSAVKCAVM